MSWADIPGWMDFEDIYDQAVAEAQDGDILVEVGVAYGRSLAYLARKAIDSKKCLDIIGIDPWEEGWGYDEAMRAAAKAAGGAYEAFEAQMAAHAPEEWAYVDVWQATSTAAARNWMSFDLERPSFVFIDADHSYESVLEDISAWLPLVKPGGVIAGHDHTGSYPGVEKAVREVFGSAYEVRNTSWWKRVT